MAVDHALAYIYANFYMFLLLLLLFLVAYILLRDPRQPGLPPGPRPWPLIGNIPHISGDLTQALLRLKQQYGDVITLYLGSSRPTVFLLSTDVIRDALVKHSYAFSGRPGRHYIFFDMKGDIGIASPSGQVFRDQKKFAVATLREFGMGRSQMESRIQDEVEYFINMLLKQEGKPLDPTDFITCAIANVTHRILFNHRNDYDDLEFRKQLQNANFLFYTWRGDNPVQMMPFLKYIPGDPFRYKEAYRVNSELRDYYRNKINENKKTYTEDEVRNFTDAYLDQIAKSKGDPLSNYNDEQLLGNVIDMMDGTTDTIKGVIRWGIAYLLHHPDIMARVTAEIDDVIGSDRMPGSHDRSKMPYTEAFMLETMRIKVVGHLALPHRATEAVLFRGFSIPVDTELIPALGVASSDPDVWEKSEEFRPERFLDDKDQIVNASSFPVFSMGARACPGEGLARMQVFIIFVTLLQRVAISLPPGDPLPDLRGIIGLTVNPAPFRCVMKPRECYI